MVGYQRSAAQLCEHLGDVRLSELSAGRIEAAYRRMIAGQPATKGKKARSPLSGKTVSNAHSMLRSALKRAARDHDVHRTALIAEPPRVEKREMHWWSPAEVKAFLRFTTGHPLFIAWVLAAATGMRRGEVLGLRWCDVDLENRRLHVRQTRTAARGKVINTTPKSDTSIRTVRLNAATVAALRDWQWQQAELAVAGGGWPLDLVVTLPNGEAPHPDMVSKAFTASVALCDKVSPMNLHGLRHSWATTALSNRLDLRHVAQQLGHSTTTITRNLYAHVSEDDELRVVDTVADQYF